MPYALIQGDRIAQIVAAQKDCFPVAPSLQWVSVANDTTDQDTYVNGAVVKYQESQPTEGPRLVRKSLIVERLNAAGKLAAASAALNSDLYARERWYAPDQPGVHADNPEVLALLAAIGAKPEDILAPD